MLLTVLGGAGGWCLTLGFLHSRSQDRRFEWAWVTRAKIPGKPAGAGRRETREWRKPVMGVLPQRVPHGHPGCSALGDLWKTCRTGLRSVPWKGVQLDCYLLLLESIAAELTDAEGRLYRHCYLDLCFISVHLHKTSEGYIEEILSL